MIQPKTLEALNYFLDEDIQNCKDSIEDYKGKENLISFYKGQIVGLEYAKELVNQQWKWCTILTEEDVDRAVNEARKLLGDE